MLAKQFRLPSSVTFRSPSILNEKFFLMKSQKNDLPCNRFGFVVGKTIDKRASVRNSIKRSFRSYIEQHWLQKAGGYDVLFILRAGIKAANKEEIEQKIDETLRKAGL